MTRSLLKAMVSGWAWWCGSACQQDLHEMVYSKEVTAAAMGSTVKGGWLTAKKLQECTSRVCRDLSYTVLLEGPLQCCEWLSASPTPKCRIEKRDRALSIQALTWRSTKFTPLGRTSKCVWLLQSFYTGLCGQQVAACLH